MNKLVIYQNELGGVGVLVPSGDLPVAEVARKDTPAGAPYLIVDSASVPSDRTFRMAWEADFSNPDGHGIGHQAWFIEQYRAEIAAINAASAPVQGKEQSDDDFAVYVAAWEASKVQCIAQLELQISVQQQEMTA